MPVSFITFPDANLKEADTLSNRGHVFKCIVYLFIVQTIDTMIKIDILKLHYNVPENYFKLNFNKDTFTLLSTLTKLAVSTDVCMWGRWT